MPITKIDLTGSAKYIEQTCINCGYKQRIALDKGAQATKEEPFKLKDGGTLTLSVDGGAATTVTFSNADFANIAAATATELVAALNKSLTGAVAALDASPDCVVIESASSGTQSSIVIEGGSDAKALGFTVLGDHPGCHRPEAGRVFAGQHLTDLITLRTCHGCAERGVTSVENIMRVWDTTPDEPAYKHRRVVNALFEWMKSNGHVNHDLILDYAAEDEVPPDLLADIDKSVIEVPMAVRTESDRVPTDPLPLDQPTTPTAPTN